MRNVSAPPRLISGSTLIAACTLALACTVADRQPAKWIVKATPETSIGETFGDDDYTFQLAGFARFLPGGRIVVADKGVLDVRIFGSDGTLEKRIGRRGQGPGEFAEIGGLWLTSKGAIALWDASHRRITTYNAQGDLLGTHRVTNYPEGGNLEILLGALSDDEIIIASLFPGEAGPQTTPDRWPLGRFGPDGEFKEKAGEVRGMWRYNRHPVPFSPMPHMIVYRDSVYVADGYEGEIAVRDLSGAAVRVIRLPQLKPPSAQAIWTALESKLRERKAGLYLEYLRDDRVPRENRYPQIAGLLVDDQGYIWVKAYDPFVDPIWLRSYPLWPAPGGEWRVIRPDGSIVATVRMPPGVRPLEIKGNRLLGVALDELDVQRIVVHTIQR